MGIGSLKKHDKFHAKSEGTGVSIYDYTANLSSGASQGLSEYRGQVLLVVNTASNCGYTPQFEGLENLYGKYAERGFSVLGFPCNQFGGQEPGTNEEILNYCMTEFAVSFPVFEKIKVNGPDTHPIYQYLKKGAKGLLGSESVKWNFTKFLVDADGNVVRRYGSKTKPATIEKDVKALLG